MTEAEILFPVQCPVCAQQALTGFRISVVADALRTGEIRLYALCHIASWEASEKEIYLLHEYLEAGWSEEMQEACRQIDFENSARISTASNALVIVSSTAAARSGVFVHAVFQDVLHRACVPSAAVFAGDVIGVEGVGDHGEAPAVVPALPDQMNHRHLLDGHHQAIADPIESVGRVIVHLALLFLVGQHGGGALGHEVAFEFGASGHQRQKHPAHRWRCKRR